MEIRVVSAGRGWQWLLNGFALFNKARGTWMAITLILALIWLASFLLPVLGSLVFNLLSPVFFAGLMLGCRAVENDEPLEIGHLFAGFRQQAGALVTIGGVYLVGTIAVMGIVLVSAGGAMLPTVLSKGAGVDLETLSAAVRSLMLALVIGATVYVPLIMFIWFAPLLVAFEGMAPFPAMKLSFSACLRNTMSFLVYGLALLAMWAVMSLPALAGVLGSALVVVLLVVSIPILFCSIYASYRDIFTPPAAPAPAAGGNPFLRG
jgi:hypothetical protein